MNTKFYTLYTLFVLSLCSCKKEKIVESNIAYIIANKNLRVSDPNPMTVDIDGNGTVDFTFFMVEVAYSTHSELNVGVNPLGNNAAKMAPPDDEKFQNMGKLYAYPNRFMIDESLMANQIWGSDYAYLVIKRTDYQGAVSYLGDWKENTVRQMALKVNLAGKEHYGWARLKFDKNTEILTLIDYAWNREANKGILAGSY